MALKEHKLREEERTKRQAERDKAQQERIDAYVKKVVAEAPPLTQEQICRLSVLLKPARDHIYAQREAQRKELAQVRRKTYVPRGWRLIRAPSGLDTDSEYLLVPEGDPDWEGFE